MPSVLHEAESPIKKEPKNTPAHATVGFSEGQKALVDEMLEEEEKKLKKLKPLWKVSINSSHIICVPLSY